MKIIEIRNCEECPHGKYVDLNCNFVNYKCELMNKVIDIDGIHPDCPLKDGCSPEPSMYDVVCK